MRHDNALILAAANKNCELLTIILKRSVLIPRSRSSLAATNLGRQCFGQSKILQKKAADCETKDFSFPHWLSVVELGEEKGWRLLKGNLWEVVALSDLVLDYQGLPRPPQRQSKVPQRLYLRAIGWLCMAFQLGRSVLVQQGVSQHQRYRLGCFTSRQM